MKSKQAQTLPVPEPPEDRPGASAAELAEQLREARAQVQAARAEVAATRAEADRAIQALAESEKRYRLMGETIPFGVWWCNPSGEAEYVSPSFCDLLDMTLEEQNRFGWTRRLVPEDVEPMLRHWRYCCDTGTPWDYEHRIVDRHQQMHTVLSRGMPVRDERTGEVQAWVGVNLDITARKRIETELTEAKEALEQALRVKDQFLANISHELRTPLTLILAPVRGLAAAPNLDEDQRRELAVVERNARTLLRTVNDLLDLSKVDAGRMEASFAEVDLAWLTRWVASHFEAIGEERHLRFEVRTPRSLLAEADPEKLERVLFNLLSNAFKFTPRGGAIRLELEALPDRARFVVEDDGPGIPGDMREAIFERFRQVDASSTRSVGGTGLGLSIVKEFVGLLRGSVRAEGAEGHGARFTVDLPLRAPSGSRIHPAADASEELARTWVSDLQARRGPPAAAPSPPPNAGTVLVVEDNEEMNAFLSRTLGAHHRVVSAFDGEEGLEMARRQKPDLIVSDLMMPRMSGEQMVQAIRAEHEMDDVPILLLTAKADEGTRVDQLRGGAQDYLVKPFVAEELLVRADGLVERKRRAERQLRESYALLHAVTEGIRDAVFVKDVAGRYRMINAAGAHRLGRSSAEEVKGQDDASLLAPEEAARVRAADGQAISSPSGVTYEEAMPVDGEARHYLTSKAPHRDAAGRIVGVLGIARDVTELKRTEQELRALQRELELRVEQRTADLAAANRELEAFAYTVSHDLQAPLRHIESFAALLRQRAGEGLDEKSLSYLGRITDGGKRMGTLITDLLALSRLGRAPMAERDVDLGRLVDEVLAELGPQMLDRAIHVRVAPLPVVRGDRTLLHSVVLNLLSNAVKYTRTRASAEIEVTWSAAGGDPTFGVRDNGVGFDPRFRDRLFGVFQRLHPAEKFEGTGVGLASVRRAVERHGGRVWAESEVDRGSRFFFSLPKERLVEQGNHEG